MEKSKYLCSKELSYTSVSLRSDSLPLAYPYAENRNPCKSVAWPNKNKVQKIAKYNGTK